VTTITCTNNKGKKKNEKTVTKLAQKMSVVTEFEENEVIWEGGRENYVRQKIFFGILKLRGSSNNIDPQLVSRRRCPPALEPAPRIRGHLIESAFQE
jgi:hypothetical protein